MPQQIINVFDRHTYQTEKVKGFDIVRMFKGSALTSEENSGYIEVSQGNNIIQTFTQTLQSNYKGTNLINLTKLENFNSFRITANGLFRDENWFNFDLKFFDISYNLINIINSNYGNKLSNIPNSGVWFDWYLDIELTFYIDDAGDYNFLVNGNHITQVDESYSRRADVRLIPFNGKMNLGTNNRIYIDLSPWNGGNSDYIIKSVNIDFVE
jgi:hypothetical protein